MEEKDAPGDDLEVRGPFGWSVKAGGRYVAILVVVFLSTSALAYMLREHDLKQTAQLAAAGEQRGKQIEQVAAQQRQLMESMEAMIYVLAASPEERARFKLAMPPAFRARLIDQERAR